MTNNDELIFKELDILSQKCKKMEITIDTHNEWFKGIRKDKDREHEARRKKEERKRERWFFGFIIWIIIGAVASLTYELTRWYCG